MFIIYKFVVIAVIDITVQSQSHESPVLAIRHRSSDITVTRLHCWQLPTYIVTCSCGNSYRLFATFSWWRQSIVIYKKLVFYMVYKCFIDGVCVIVSQTALLMSSCDSFSHCASAICTYFHLWWSPIAALTTSIVSRVSYVHSWCTYLCSTHHSRTFQWSIGRSQLLQYNVCHSIVLQKWRKWKLFNGAVSYTVNHRFIFSDCGDIIECLATFH